jgi:hypothetical protein
MKKDCGGLAGKMRSNALELFFIILLLLPSSSSVLCIAPGNHVAIEEINALCCVSSANPLMPRNQPDTGFSRLGECDNCIDILLISNGSGELSQSGKNVSPSQSDAKYLDVCFPPDFSASLWLISNIRSADASIPASTPVPLRC